MKKLLIPIGFLLLFFVSCKKDKDEAKDSKRNELIIGTWTAVAFGTDLNGDNVLQESEKQPIKEGDSLIQTYNKDGTGKIVTMATGQPTKTTQTTWKLTDNNNVLEVNESSKTTRARILTLTPSEISGYDESVNPHVIIILRK